MDTPNMITLPPKYLKPIYMNVNSTDIQTTTSTTSYATDYSTTQNYQFEQTTSTDYQIPTTDYNTTTSTDTTNYNTTIDYSASISQPTFSTTATTLAATPSMGAQSGFKLIRRGSGITANEQNSIVSTAMNIMQSGLTPISNQTARGVKKKLGGDWLVIVYPEGKSIDFNMTCVQGNDYLYFILNSYAFQVCRLK
jgi:hypothetical protein